MSSGEEEQDQPVVENPYATSTEVDAPGEPETPVEGKPYSYAHRKRTILLMLLGYAAVMGAAVVFLPENDRILDAVLSLPIIVMSVVWCRIDAAEHEYRMSKWMTLGLIFLFTIAFPIYVFRTRGVAGFKTLGWTLLFVIAMLLCQVATAFVAGGVFEIVHILRNG